MGGEARTGWHRFAGAVASLLAAAGLVLAFGARPADADSTVCESGSGAGQCANPQGVATDFETGRLYVADRGNDRIDVFAANGAFLFAFGWRVSKAAPAEEFQICTGLTGCQAGSSGAGDGQFDSPRQVAVDNYAASPSRHCVYVFDSGNLRVQKFCPAGDFVTFTKKSEAPVSLHDPIDLLAVGPAGNVYVSDMPELEEQPRIVRLDSDLSFIEECVVPHGDRLNGGLAVDSAGKVYATFNKGGGVFAFEGPPGCGQLGSPYPLEQSLEAAAVTVNSAGTLYAARVLKRAGFGFFRTVTMYSSTGAILRRYGFDSPNNPISGIAPASSPEGVFVSEQFAAVKRLVEPPPGPVVASLETAQPTGNVRATLKAEVDPEGKATSYHFQYVDEAHFKAEGWASSATKTTATESLPGAADFELHLASATVGCTSPLLEPGQCLTPETVYRYRVLASNADGEGNSPVEGSFESGPPIEIEDFASEVGTGSARLVAIVNPRGLPTTGYFEYVSEAQYQESGFAQAIQIPNVRGGAEPLDLGEGEAWVTKSVSVQLQPGSAYRMRFVGTDPLLDEPVIGPERAFRTFIPEGSAACPQNEAFRGGFSSHLPDCRAYELVSPLDKEGGDIVAQEDTASNPAVLSQSAVSGEKLAYGSYRAFGDAKAAPRTSQYIAQRTPGGWVSHYALGPRGRITELVLNAQNSELRQLSPDLCQGWVRTVAEPILAPNAVEGQMNLYRRHDQAADCGGAESWEAISTVPPPPPLDGYGVDFEVQGTSVDGGTAIYIAKANLQSEGAVQPPPLKGDEPQLYYQEPGEGFPHFVCVMPNGTAAKKGCGAGTSTASFGGIARTASLTGAISEDGSRVFWSTPALDPGKIYLRENPGAAESAAKDGSGNCLPEEGAACTIAVSKAGEELSGTSSATSSSQFWAADPGGDKALYSTQTSPASSDLYLFDVDTRTTTLIAHKVIGVLGESRDLGRIYLASEEALTGEEENSGGQRAVAGKANVYLYAAGNFRFVARLSASDANSQVGALNPKPATRTVRVTPNGEAVAFMSNGNLTGYESADARNGEADTEVYLYDAGGNGGTGKLVCASCNPTGGRPAGQERAAITQHFWAAAWLPVWRTSLYAGTFLSSDGTRLYFESSDAMAPRDTNGGVDVYQWEAPGSGGCSTASTSYSPQDEGCVSPISSGQGAGNAELLDASPRGDDVFFTTAQSLLPEDYGLVDAYDARVGGGLPEPPLPEAGCEGEACQPSTPAPEAIGPASLHYRGPRNAHRRRRHHKAKHRHHHHHRKHTKHGGASR
jgi:DNA-binding beta-propeller fold protein YncE